MIPSCSVLKKRSAVKSTRRRAISVKSVQRPNQLIDLSKKNRKHIVYSTNPDFEYDYNEDDELETKDPQDQLLYVSIDRKNRGGKEVTLIEGFVGSTEDMKDLAKLLKSKCGVGGGVKSSEILIQGNFRDKVVQILSDLGYGVKKKGG